MNIDKRKEYHVGDYVFINYINVPTNLQKTICDWRNDPIERKFSYNSDIILFDNHLKFIKGLENREDAAYWLVLKKSMPVGVSNLTSINTTESRAELGYGLNPELRNKGLGVDYASANFQFAFNIIGCNHLFGGIVKSNINAIILDSYFGCQLNQDDVNNIEKVEIIRWTFDKIEYCSQGENQKTIRGLVDYMKQNKEYLNHFKKYAK